MNAYYAVAPPVPVVTIGVPALSPSPGLYSSAVMVTISDATANVAIYYTVDGTTPTAQSSRYTGSISVPVTQTIKAIAVLGASQSGVETGVYVIGQTSLGTAATPTFSSAAGLCNGTETVAIADATLGATIYYTTNGSSPTSASTIYSGPILVSSSETIEAIAVAPGYGNSAVATAMYSVPSHVASGEWTWMSGSNLLSGAAVYGTKGVGSCNTNPGARTASTTWTDGEGNFWLFGGIVNVTPGDLNDLWEYSPANGAWTWVSGSNTVGVKGTYGTLGLASTGNTPGAREEAVGWADRSGNLWLFGGDGFDATGTLGPFNDLWEFNIANHEWTWVSGSNSVPGAVGSYGIQGVASASNVPEGRNSSNGWIDGQGNLWLFGGLCQNGAIATGNACNALWEFSPATREWTWVSGSTTPNAMGVYGSLGVSAAGNGPGARYASASWIDAGGNLWLLGGGIDGYDSFNDLWRFSPVTKEWTWVGGASTLDMQPSYGTLGVAAASNNPGARYSEASWVDGSGNLWLYGGRLGQTGFYDDLWQLNVTTGQWVWVGGNSMLNAPAVYGTLGMPLASNLPGSRDYPSAWVDTNGNFWLYGGAGYATGLGYGATNDLWVYRP